MTVRIPVVRQDYARRASPAAPQVSAVGMGGVLDAGRSLLAAAADRERAEAMRREAADSAERDMDRSRAAEKLAQAQLDWTKHELERRQNFDASTGKPYAEQVHADFETFAEKTARSASSEFEREILRGRLTAMRSTIVGRAMEFEAGQRLEFKRSAMTTALDRRVATAMIDPSQAVDLTAQQLAEVNAVEGLPADDRREAAQKARNAIAFAALRASAQRDPDAVLQRLGVRGGATGKSGKPGASDVDQGLAALSGDPLVSGLSAPSLKSLIDEATQLSEARRQKIEHEQEVRARRAEAAQEKRQRDAEHATKALQGLIDGGSLPDAPFLADVTRKAAGTPYAETVAGLVKQGADRAGFASLTPEAQREQLLAIRAQANAQGSNPALEQRLRSAEEIHARQTALIDKDALRWGLNTRLLPELPALQFTDLATLTQQIGQRVDPAATVSAKLGGRGVSPLLAEEAHRMAELLGGLPLAQKAAAVRELATRMSPDQQRALSAQVRDKNGTLGLAMFAATQPAGGTDLVALILRGDDAIKAGRIKKAGDDGVAAADRQKIARELDRVAWPTPLARDAAIDAAGLVYDGLRDQKGGSASWRDAINLATGGLADWNDKRIPVPPGWDDRRFRQAMRNVDAVTIAGQTRGPLLVNGKEVRAEDLAKAWGTLDLIPIGPGQYALDTGGAVVTTANRRPFVFTLRD